MLSAYINYPNPHVTLHFNISCGLIRPHEASGQRIMHINVNTVSDVLRQFAGKEVRFAAEKGLNDLWLFVAFDNREYEEATVAYIQKLIGRRFKPLLNAPVKIHCE